MTITALEKAATAVHEAPWETLSQFQQLAALRSARAVLMAVRDAGGPVRTAGAAAIRSVLPNQYTDGPIAGQAFAAMIDAILAEQPS